MKTCGSPPCARESAGCPAWTSLTVQRSSGRNGIAVRKAMIHTNGTVDGLLLVPLLYVLLVGQNGHRDAAAL